jgi:hypothetical protein
MNRVSWQNNPAVEKKGLGHHRVNSGFLYHPSEDGSITMDDSISVQAVIMLVKG